MYSFSLARWATFAALSLAALPLSDSFLLDTSNDVKEAVNDHLDAKRATKQNLRILPVGDSITFGKGSTDGNGYRLDLRNELIFVGFPVDFIGRNSDGSNNPDNQHEGFSLNNIQQITDQMKSDSILLQHPNLILIHAGTNDNLESNAEGAPERLGEMLDYILTECYDAVLLVAKLVQNNFNQTQTDYFNARVPGIVQERSQKGFKVYVVDQSGIGGNLLDDGEHPNDDGYKAMADNWFNSIYNLPSGTLTPPR